MKRPIAELFFDCSSPWSYIAFERLISMAARLEFEICWRPVVVGGVFNRVNPGFGAARTAVPAKAAYAIKDIGDWARADGLVLNFPPTLFPVNSVAAMRLCLAAEAFGQSEAVARALFRAYFGDDQNLAVPDVLRNALSSLEDADAIFDLAGTQDIKRRLVENAEELIGRGGFGVPTTFLGADMYFGADRLWLVGDAVRALTSDRP